MTLFVILIAISIQRFFHLLSEPCRLNWSGHYYNWCVKQIEYTTKGHGLLGLAILIVPMLLVASVIFSMVFHVFGFLGYMVLSLLLFWYCSDAHDLSKAPDVGRSLQSTLLYEFQSVFGPMFWFAVFGPMGLMLYYLVHHFKHYLISRSDAESRELEYYATQVGAVLDWAPARLFSFCFALFGSFSAVLKEWLPIAITFDPHLTIITDSAKPVMHTRSDLVNMIDRSLAAWLIVMAIITISSFLGH